MKNLSIFFIGLIISSSTLAMDLKCHGVSNNYYSATVSIDLTASMPLPTLMKNLHFKLSNDMKFDGYNIEGNPNKHPTTIVFGDKNNFSASNCYFTVEILKTLRGGKLNSWCDQLYAPLYFSCQ